MSNSWNKVSLAKEEPKLLEIMSEELCNRLHIDNNFVWIDILEAQQVNNVTEPAELESEFEFITKEDSSVSNALTVADVAQFSVKGENTGTKQNYHEDDFEWDEREQSDYFEGCDDVRVKPIEFPKSRHHRPLTKHKEHGTNQNYMSDKTKEVDEQSKLQPKIIFRAPNTATFQKFIDDNYLGQYNIVIRRKLYTVVTNANRGFKRPPEENVVKLYKIGINEDYNKFVYKIVQREFQDLRLLADLRFPWPLRAIGKVLIMSFMGSYLILNLYHERHRVMFNRIIKVMDKYYNDKQLVHGGLSPKKILLGHYDTYFRGWSHSVKSDHAQALSKLMRDCKFLKEFYAVRGVNLKSTTEDLFKKMTKASKISDKLLEIINEDAYKKYDTNPNRTHSRTKPNNNTTVRFK